MDCPQCKTDLVMAERQGVEIDQCPKCRGVWLDRGELDKIIERSNAYSAAYGSGRGVEDDFDFPDAGGDHRTPPRPAGPNAPPPPPYPHEHRKRKSFWEEIFD